MKSNHLASLEFYKKNQDSLVKKYNGKTLVLRNEDILEVCDAYGEAYEIAVEKYGEGNFTLQEVYPGQESFTAFIATPGLVKYS